MNVLIKFPSRGRPEKFKNTLETYIKLLSRKHDVKFIFTFDEDDSTMNAPKVREYLDGLSCPLKYYYGNSKSKIEAINANLEREDFDVLILAADDLVPFRQDYDDIICRKFEESPHGLDCMLHFYTSRWSFELDIMNIMGKLYYDRFGYIYHPDYKSIFCDNEYTEVARQLDKQVTVLDSLFNHNWQSGDSTEIKNWQFNTEDYHTYVTRKNINFGINL